MASSPYSVLDVVVLHKSYAPRLQYFCVSSCFFCASHYPDPDTTLSVAVGFVSAFLASLILSWMVRRIVDPSHLLDKNTFVSGFSIMLMMYVAVATTYLVWRSTAGIADFSARSVFDAILLFVILTSAGAFVVFCFSEWLRLAIIRPLLVEPSLRTGDLRFFIERSVSGVDLFLFVLGFPIFIFAGTLTHGFVPFAHLIAPLMRLGSGARSFRSRISSPSKTGSSNGE